MSQSVRLNSRARENIHSITHSHKNISSLNDLLRKICICQFFCVPLHPIWVHSTKPARTLAKYAIVG